MRARVEIAVREVGWEDAVGVALRAAMASEMNVRYADLLARFAAGSLAELNVLEVEGDEVAYVGVAYDADGLPVGHAALRRNRDDLELKRMYVVPSHRGRGVSTALLDAVENAGRAAGVPRLILHTGDRQPDAVRLYEREGWTRIPIFPPYERLTFSICMEKIL